MIRIEADTLEEAYSKSAAQLTCSVTQITFKVIQNPSSGFLGMFKKSAIIEARRLNEPAHKVRDNREKPKKNKRNKNQKEVKTQIASTITNNEERQPKRKSEETKSTTTVMKKFTPRTKRENKKTKIEINKAVVQIQQDINSLFAHSCYELDEIKVEAYNEDTVLVEFNGEDAALLIGKEGYRYKALSYLLYNWINIKYNLNVRLEIAEFLKNQEEMIAKYLVSIIERINNTGRGQTKILDGVLVKIALEALRAEFPDKYVGIKSGREGGRFIVINDFNRKK